MSENNLVLGVDGCKGGWIAIGLEAEQWSADLFPDLELLWQTYAHATLILLDMPIGLPEKTASRACDQAARKLLGPRRSSVFSPPCRAAVYADSYQKASAINFSLTGKKISKQAWFISARICEVDQLLRANPSAKRVLMEAHPELAFTALAGTSPQFNKKKEEGFQERMQLLTTFFPEGAELIEHLSAHFLRKELARDDMVDALCLAVHAKLALEKGLFYLPANPPPMDAVGLPMQIVCARTGNLPHQL